MCVRWRVARACASQSVGRVYSGHTLPVRTFVRSCLQAGQCELRRGGCAVARGDGDIGSDAQPLCGALHIVPRVAALAGHARQARTVAQHGCRLFHIRLQALPHTVAGAFTYGCWLFHFIRSYTHGTFTPIALVLRCREAEARRVVRWLEGGGEAEAATTVGAIAAAARGERTVTWRGLFNPRVVPLRTPHTAQTPVKQPHRARTPE